MKTNLILTVVLALAAILPSCVPMVLPEPVPPPPCMVGGQPGFDPGFNGPGYNPRFHGQPGFHQPGPIKPIGLIPGTGINIYGDAAASVVNPRRCWGPPPIRHFNEQQRTTRNWGE